jgi:MATE family multidrug resistance protein
MLYVDQHDTLNYSDNMEVIAIAGKLLIASAFFQLSDSLQVVVLGALRGLQDVKIPTILTFISYWIVGFPISYFLGDETILGSFGIWIGLLAGLTTASILLFIRFNRLSLKLIQTKESKT